MKLDTKAAAEYLYTLYSGLKFSAKVQPDREAIEAVVGVAMKVLG